MPTEVSYSPSLTLCLALSCSHSVPHFRNVFITLSISPCLSFSHSPSLTLRLSLSHDVSTAQSESGASERHFGCFVRWVCCVVLCLRRALHAVHGDGCVCCVLRVACCVLRVACTMRVAGMLSAQGFRRNTQAPGLPAPPSRPPSPGWTEPRGSGVTEPTDPRQVSVRVRPSWGECGPT